MQQPCKVCVSAVEPEVFINAVEVGAHVIEIRDYDSFHETGRIFSLEEIMQLTMKTRQLIPSVVLSVTVPHTLSLTDQVIADKFLLSLLIQVLVWH